LFQKAIAAIWIFLLSLKFHYTPCAMRYTDKIDYHCMVVRCNRDVTVFAVAIWDS